MKKNNESVSLYRWIWISYLKAALIPLILVELVFIIIYFSSNKVLQIDLIKFLKSEVQNNLINLSEKEASIIHQQLVNVKNATELYRKEMESVFFSEVETNKKETERLKYSTDRVYYSSRDDIQGGAAVFYSGIVPIKEKEREKVLKVLSTQNFMKNLKNTQSLVASLYLNTFDSLNVIYPYFDVLTQYSPKMNISQYNFYYEADKKHNPFKNVVWTDVYLDPAGHGWMTSVIAPVYNGDFLEGVVGLDITVDNIINQVLNIEIPYGGYGILIGKDGTILALPPKGEKDLGLNELTNHSYQEAIKKDTFKPDEFNIYKRKDLSGFSENIRNSSKGIEFVTLKEKKQVASWQTIEETGWKLLFIIPENNVYSKVNELSLKLFKIGLFMITGLIFFYAVFFYVLSKKARIMSHSISKPLEEIEAVAEKIGNGFYIQKIPDAKVIELHSMANSLVKMGDQLGDTNTELLKTQEKLIKSEIKLQTLINSMDDVLIEVNINGEIQNVWAKDRNKLSKAYLEGSKSIDTIFNEEVSLIIKEKISKVSLSGKSETMEYRLETELGLKWFQANISKFGNSGDTVVVSARDISKLKEIEKSLLMAKEDAEKANIAKSQFLSNMSHELRTPLNAILGFAQVLSMDIENPLSPDQNESISEILKAGTHLLKLINEILDLARIESGKLILSLEPVKINLMIEEVLSMMKPIAKKSGIEISLSYMNCEEEFIMVDYTRIKQVLINLISNAIKYNRENGKVLLYCEKTDNNTIRFNITDTGLGISKENLDLIFKPFYRIQNFNTAIEGTGIGLTVVKEIIESMNGKIWVSSDLGVGTHFWIEINCVKESERLSDGLFYSVSRNNYLNGKTTVETQHKIVYIEDNPSNLILIENIFKYIPNMTMITGTNGEMCQELVKINHPNLILLDINLPGIDGFEVLSRLKNDENTKHIPVIAISASAMSEDIIKGKEQGFAAYLTKPIDIKKFISLITSIFNGNK